MTLRYPTRLLRPAPTTALLVAIVWGTYERSAWSQPPTSAAQSSSEAIQEPSNTLDFSIVAKALETATTSAIERAEKAVVAIARVRKDQVTGNRADQLLIPNLIPPSEIPGSPEFVPTEFGSGVVISSDGYLVTCAHVLDDPNRFQYFVWLNKRMYQAEVVGKPATVLASDPYTDLAVLKIEAEGLEPIEFGDTSSLRKGAFVVALGNPYAIARDGSASASWGIVSNLQRLAPATESSSQKAGILTKDSQHQFGTLIQTDARLNLGTSGGALIDMKGQLLGLTTSLAATSGYEQSAGFAIAVDDMFKRVVETLKSGKLPEFGFLGIQPEELRPEEKAAGLSGARVAVVVPNMPGDEAGLRPEDRIVEINRVAILDRNGLFRQLSQLPAGAEVDLLVHRPRRSLTDYTTVPLKAKLSKKLITTSRPSYAVNGPAKWRGLVVEYATAIPGELLRNNSNRRIPAKLTLLSVDPESPAWQAGLRPGHALLGIQGMPIDSPEAFYQRASAAVGTVSLQVVRSGDKPEVLRVTE